MRKPILVLLAALAVSAASCGENGEGQPAKNADGQRQSPSQPGEKAAPKPEPKVAPTAKTAPQPRPETPGGTSGQSTSNQAQLERSLQAWNALKAKCGGNYSYKIRWSSWVGFGHETEIVVRQNKVAERRYREWSGKAPVIEPGKPPKPEGETWTEQGKRLGSHKKGAPPKTLDELYQEAKKILGQELQPHHRLYVRFDDQGLLKSCFYVDTRIADDAPQTGVVINSIELETARE